MNSCVLMAEVLSEPELRYLQDGQMIAELTVQFPALRAEDPMETLKVLGWGNLAQQIQEQFHIGDQLVLEGRLNMVVVDRPEGFKEKRAELTVNRIHRVQTDLHAPQIASSPAPPAPQQPPRPTPPSTPVPTAAAPTAPAKPPVMPSAPLPSDDLPSYDDIPF